MEVHYESKAGDRDLEGGGSTGRSCGRENDDNSMAKEVDGFTS